MKTTLDLLLVRFNMLKGVLSVPEKLKSVKGNNEPSKN